MRRRPNIRQRQRIFIATEGAADAAFATWLKQLSEGHGADLAIVVRACAGGSPTDVVRDAERLRDKELRNDRFRACIVILDGDREMADPTHAARVAYSARASGLVPVVLRPRYEAVLVRLHPGNEQRFVEPGEDERILRRLWPGIWDGNHRKPIPTNQLAGRFTLADLHRAAPHDEDLRALLGLVGLWPPPQRPS